LLAVSWGLIMTRCPSVRSGPRIHALVHAAYHLGRRAVSAWGAPLLVWGVWGALVLGGLVYVLRFGSQIPFMDDWNWVPMQTGAQPLTFDWLWEQVDDHRAPLSKLLILGVYTVAGDDIRAGFVANILALGALAFAMICTAKKLRGWTHYADVFFPLAVLNFDNEITLMGLGVSIVPSTVVAGLLLLLIARSGHRLTFGAALGAGVGVLLLALIGTTGLALVPALALWLGYIGFRYWRSPGAGGKRKGLLVWGLAAAALFMVPLYFIDYQKTTPRSAGLPASLRTSFQFLSCSFGQAAAYATPDRIISAWPALLGSIFGHAAWYPFGDYRDDPVAPVLGFGLVILALVSTGLLARVWYQKPWERARALGLFMFLGTTGCLAVGIGVARSGFGPGAGYETRYVPLAMPVLWGLFFIWELYGARVGRLVVGACLLIPLLLLWPLNVMELIQYGARHRKKLDAVEGEVRAGKSAVEVVTRYGKFLNDQYKPNKLAAYVNMLRRAAIGPFRHLSDGPDVVNPDEENEFLHQQWLANEIRKVVQAKLPADAKVVVISENVNELLKLGEQRQGWHFPHVKGGTAHGDNPKDSAETIAQLEALRKEGGQFLLIPECAFWWLDEPGLYKEFNEYLDKHYPQVVSRKETKDTCVIFDLR
jgi:hypothetical protein